MADNESEQDPQYKKLEKQISIEMKKDQSNFESKTSAGRKLNSLHITEKLISNISSKLQLSKSNGPDNPGNIFFKFCSANLSKSLFLLFQTMSNKGNFPSYWKITQIILI